MRFNYEDCETRNAVGEYGFSSAMKENTNDKCKHVYKKFKDRYCADCKPNGRFYKVWFGDFKSSYVNDSKRDKIIHIAMNMLAVRTYPKKPNVVQSMLKNCIKQEFDSYYPDTVIPFNQFVTM